MSFYPVFLELEGMPALVVGGGGVAQRKVEGLLECGASIRIVSRALTERLKGLVKAGEVRFLGEEVREEFLDDAFIVIAATDDKELNSRISRMARVRGLLVNAVDQPGDCNFILPAVVRRGDLSIAVSTSGKSPALAKKIRKELDERFGEEYGVFLRLMGALRTRILEIGLSQEENRRVFHEIVDGGILEALAENDMGRVESSLGRILPLGVDLKILLKDLEPQNSKTGDRDGISLV